jgi:hypothetical protein
MLFTNILSCAYLALNYMATAAGWVLERAHSNATFGQTLAMMFVLYGLRRLVWDASRTVWKHMQKVLKVVGALFVGVACWKMVRMQHALGFGVTAFGNGLKILFGAAQIVFGVVGVVLCIFYARKKNGSLKVRNATNVPLDATFWMEFGKLKKKLRTLERCCMHVTAARME